jgi:very-short-patch-repair endonuclease
MQENILPKLEASRKELLDLGMRNPLLNYRTPKARGLHIVQEQSTSIYDILVKQNKAMTFLGRPGKDDDEEVLDIPELTAEELKDAYNDTRLQTNEKEQKLQVKILNTYYFAKTSIEEQGVNILYLSLGMLNWFDKVETEEPRTAPLVLIPVSLERSSASERFRLRFNGGDIGANLSLQAKMMADFNITIPDLSEPDDFNIESYFKSIEERIGHQNRWKIDRDAIELGFFSFGKFMIYHDLDSAKWPADAKPFDHPILSSLFDGGFNEAQPTATEEHNLDKETKAHELFTVVDADSSQVLAMLAVHEGRNMVIQGPPGTGKSQTITNIIANAVGHGKKVLFVAEKMAALDVVKRRLDSINLGEACLELHSHKANKRDLHEELKRVLDLGKPTLTQLQEEIALLDVYKGQLNGYCNSVNRAIEQSGLSAQKVIGFLMEIAEQYKDIKLPSIPLNGIESWNAETMRRASALADIIETRLKDIGIPAQLLFHGTGLTLFLPHETEATTGLLHSAAIAVQNMVELSTSAASFTGTTAPTSYQQLLVLIDLLEYLSHTPDLKDIAVKDQAWVLNPDDIKELFETGKQLSALRLQYENILHPEAWDQNVLEIRQNLIEHGPKWYKFLLGDYKQSVKQLASFSSIPLPESLEARIKYTDDILLAKRLSNVLNENAHLATPLFGARWRVLKTNWTALEEVLTFLTALHRDITAGRFPVQILDFLSRNENPATIKDHLQRLKDATGIYQQNIDDILKKLGFTGDHTAPAKGFNELPFTDQLGKLKAWGSRLNEIQHAVQWNNLTEQAHQEGFDFLVSSALDWEGAAQYLKVSVQKTWYEYLVTKAMTERPPLRGFERTSHEEIISKFIQLDLLNLQYNRAKVALKHYESVPKLEGGGQWNILRSEFNKRARHMPIRKLMEQAGMAIQTIKPVLMMSPMSIANFLSPDSIDFDLVIFDEASQVRPVEALGAILRGKQLVVVGDSKQLPPTSFFDKMNAETEDEENVTADIQSILGMCDGQGAPQRMLRWHYRSRHESLISLSNREFYENKLVIFPSPGSKYRMGLAFHHLPDAIYDRGKTRSNPIEAEEVAKAVFDHALKNPKQSLGVVAFSTAQMQAIQNAIEIKRRQNPESELFFRRHAHEPFFVKNLENVQGDERDVIFISIGYGRTEDGRVPMSFGPLNNDGGERRLNVLITRAKYRCEVFTNITSEDINPTATTKFGIRALKNFLYFAQHGTFESEQDVPVPDKRPFEDMLAAQLAAKGYIVRKKVGSEGFYIDLAIVDQENPGRYLLGIECDGDAYSNAKSARDRDRLRGQVLENIGWDIFKVWSVEWYRNPERELQRLVAAIESAKAQTLVQDQADDDLQQEIAALAEEAIALAKEKNALQREEKEEVTVAIQKYAQAVLPPGLPAQELHLVPFGKLADWIRQVIDVEGPVHFEEVARRIADASGASKIGSRIRYTLNAATDFAVSSKIIYRRGDFLWHPEMTVPTLRDRSGLTAGSRKINLISPEELDLAVKNVVESAIAIQPETAVPLIAKMFGLSRVTEEVRKDLLNAIEMSTGRGMVIKDGDYLKAPQ